MRVFSTPAELPAHVGEKLGSSDWFAIEQRHLDGYAQLTGDDFWIHVDVERAAREMPGGRTIAHGLFVLSLVPMLQRGIWRVERRGIGLNYGSDRVRYTAPVPVGSRLRLHQTLAAAERVGAATRMTTRCEMEIEGEHAAGAGGRVHPAAERRLNDAEPTDGLPFQPRGRLRRPLSETTMPSNRPLLALALAGLTGIAATFSAATVQAQAAWPTKPVRIIVPYPPGGPVDQLARAIGPKLGERLGQTIVIDNKAGAGGSLGVDAAIKAEPDGYTFGFGVPGAITVLPHLQKLPYDVEKINYVSLVARVPQVIAVSPQTPAKTLPELIALAKKEPGKLNYASAGNATTPHLGAELLAEEAGIDIVHVPYKGAAPAITALLGGEVQMLAADLSALLPFLSRGVKVVAVSGPRRVDALPEVPTTTELGLPGVQVESNYGIIAPAATPAAVTQKFREALVAVLAMPAVRAQIAAQGAIPVSNTPDEYRKLMQQESAKWARVVKKAGITLD